MREYEKVIGLEVHVELSTASKLFCSCSTKFGAAPNEHVCPACMGMPGSLPLVNKRAIELGIAAGIVTNSKISPMISFDKKNYFYPDLPSGYQITQFFAPICKDGWVEIEALGEKKKIRISQIHIEEDAGKLIHDGEFSYVDYNRAGVPLIEIVSAPDFRSAKEVVLYLEKLRSLLTFANISDCKMQAGSMRCDVNLSVRERGSEVLGTRTEMKNINSLSAIERAIEYEAARHINILESGKDSIVQETRRWDEGKGKSISMRGKEDATDYRYFPNPDILPIAISKEWVQNVKDSLPQCSDEKYNRMTGELGISEFDSRVITKSKRLSDIFDSLLAYGLPAKDASNWIVTELLALDIGHNKSADDIEIDCRKFASLIELVNRGEISRTVAKGILALVYRDGVEPIDYVKQNNLGILRDRAEIEKLIRNLITENPSSVKEYKEGNLKVFTFFVGGVMKKSSGKADPVVVREILTRVLDEV